MVYTQAVPLFGALVTTRRRMDYWVWFSFDYDRHESSIMIVLRFLLVMTLFSLVYSEESVSAELLNAELTRIASDKDLAIRVYRAALAKKLEVDPQTQSLLRIDRLEQRHASLARFANSNLYDDTLTPDEKARVIQSLDEYGQLSRLMLHMVRQHIIACRDAGGVSPFAVPNLEYVDDQSRFATQQEKDSMRAIMGKACALVQENRFSEATDYLTPNDVNGRSTWELFIQSETLQNETYLETASAVFPDMLRQIDALMKTEMVVRNQACLIYSPDNKAMWKEFGFRRVNKGPMLFYWFALKIDWRAVTAARKALGLHEDVSRGVLDRRQKAFVK